MQRQPLPDQVVGELSERQGHLRDEDHHHEIQVARTDTHVDDGLRQERQDQVQTTGHEHRKHQLYEVGLVGFEVLQQVAEFQLRVLLARRLVEWVPAAGSRPVFLLGFRPSRRRRPAF